MQRYCVLISQCNFYDWKKWGKVNMSKWYGSARDPPRPTSRSRFCEANNFFCFCTKWAEIIWADKESNRFHDFQASGIQKLFSFCLLKFPQNNFRSFKTNSSESCITNTSYSHYPLIIFHNPTMYMAFIHITLHLLFLYTSFDI